MTGPTYRVVRSPWFSRAHLALARSYSGITEAVANMGEGVVIASDGDRIVAFHERHLPLLERAAGLVAK